MPAPNRWHGSREQDSAQLSSCSERYVGRFYLGRPAYTLKGGDVAHTQKGTTVRGFQSIFASAESRQR